MSEPNANSAWDNIPLPAQVRYRAAAIREGSNRQQGPTPDGLASNARLVTHGSKFSFGLSARVRPSFSVRNSACSSGTQCLIRPHLSRVPESCLRLWPTPLRRTAPQFTQFQLPRTLIGQNRAVPHRNLPVAWN